MAKRKTLDAWIQQAIVGEDKSGKCSQIALVHMRGSQQQELHTVKFASGKSWSAKELAQLFRDRAEAYSQDLTGVQTFQLLAFYGSNEPEDFQPFKVTPAADPESPLQTEAPTQEGKTAQQMRWIDSLLSQVYRRQALMDNQASAIIEQQNRHIATLQAENMQGFQMLKELLVSAAMNNHEVRMKEIAAERTAQMQKQIMGMLPALTNTIVGREVFPLSAQDTALIEALADNIDESQMMLISQVLKPELAGPLSMRFEQHLKKKREIEETKTKALSVGSSMNPEDDAAGDAK